MATPTFLSLVRLPIPPLSRSSQSTTADISTTTHRQALSHSARCPTLQTGTRLGDPSLKQLHHAKGGWAQTLIVLKGTASCTPTLVVFL